MSLGTPSALNDSLGSASMSRSAVVLVAAIITSVDKNFALTNVSRGRRSKSWVWGLPWLQRTASEPTAPHDDLVVSRFVLLHAFTAPSEPLHTQRQAQS